MTLVEVARRAGISMATAQRYKKLYQDRIPSEGSGRKQRYPIAAVKAINDLKKERGSNRSASRKSAAAKPAAAAAQRAGVTSPALLTLSSIAKQTGISYPTLQRYARVFSDRVPSEGEGRRRRYPPEAVAVFKQLRAESKPGRKPKAAQAAKPGKAVAAKAVIAKADLAKAVQAPTPGPASSSAAGSGKAVRGKAAPKKAAAVAKSASGLLTLTAVEKQTKISGPTLQRYLRLHGDQIPWVGEGRKRRYPPEALDVFRELRSRSKRGRKPKASVAAAVAPRRAPEVAAAVVAPKPAPRKPAAPAKKTRAVKARKAVPAALPAARSSVEARLAAVESQLNQVLAKLEQPIKITLER